MGATMNERSLDEEQHDEAKLPEDRVEELARPTTRTPAGSRVAPSSSRRRPMALADGTHLPSWPTR
jgi:hypothetical protein